MQPVEQFYYVLRDREIVVLFQTRARGLPLLETVPTGSSAAPSHPPQFGWGTKLTNHLHLVPSAANVWSSTPLPTYIHGGHRENFIVIARNAQTVWGGMRAAMFLEKAGKQMVVSCFSGRSQYLSGFLTFAQTASTNCTELRLEFKDFLFLFINYFHIQWQ
jgi:hypothetical protein